MALTNIFSVANGHKCINTNRDWYDMDMEALKIGHFVDVCKIGRLFFGSSDINECLILLQSNISHLEINYSIYIHCFDCVQVPLYERNYLSAWILISLMVATFKWSSSFISPIVDSVMNIFAEWQTNNPMFFFAQRRVKLPTTIATS